MPNLIATLIINLPEDVQKAIGAQINVLYKKYSKYRTKGNTDGLYRNLPHVTLTRIVNADKHMKEIKAVMEEASQLEPFQINAHKIKILRDGNGFHIILEIKNTKEITNLHKILYYKLLPLIADARKPFGGENYYPHTSLITWLPENKAKEALKEITIKPFTFTANNISIKLMEEGKEAYIHKTYSLGEEQ
jgi:2'-5' RNA ligase